MNIDGIGTVQANCKICKFRTDIVKGVHWQYVATNSKKKDLLAYSRRGYHAGDKRRIAYYCSKFKEWHTSTCSDLDCCTIDKAKLQLYLQETMNRWKKKLEYVVEGLPLKM